MGFINCLLLVVVLGFGFSVCDWLEYFSLEVILEMDKG